MWRGNQVVLSDMSLCVFRSIAQDSQKKLATLILIVMEDALKGVIGACLDIGLSDVRQKAVQIIFPSVDNQNCFEKVIFTSQ